MSYVQSKKILFFTNKSMNYKIFVLLYILFVLGCVNNSDKGLKPIASASNSTTFQKTATLSNNQVVFSNSDVAKDILSIKNLPATDSNTKESMQYLAKAMLDFMKDNDTSALRYSNMAIQKDPNSIAAHFIRANIKTHLNDTSGVLADFNKVIQLSPKTEIIYEYRAFYKWATLHDTIGALSDQAAAITLDPNNIRAYDKRSEMRHEMGNYTGAIEDIDAILQLNPTLSDYYRYRGNEKINMKNYTGAINDYSKAIELNIHDTAAYFCRGEAEGIIKQYKNAISDLSQAIENDPKMGYAYFYRGKNEITVGEKEKGCEDLHKAQELGIQQAAIELSQSNCNNNANP